MKKLLLILITILIGYLAFLVNKKLSSDSVPTVFQFQKLPNDILAQTGTIKITYQDILDDHYKTLISKKNEVYMALAYKQFVKNPQKIKTVTFPVDRQLFTKEKLCGLYELHCAEDVKFLFNASLKNVINIDGVNVNLSNLDKNKLELQAVETDLLNYLTTKVENKIIKDLIFEYAKKSNLSAQDFLQKIVYQGKNLDTLVKETIDKSEENFKFKYSQEDRLLYERAELALLKQSLEFEFFSKKIKLPILLNLNRPHLNLDLKWNWIPHKGSIKSKSRVVFITDYESDASKKIIESILQFSKRWPHVVFGHRPFFNKKDNFQIMYAEASFCVWNEHPLSYWKFLEKLVLINKNNFEKDLYNLFTQLNLNKERLQKCFLERKYKDVVTYHLDWSAHFGIKSSPVVFIQDEVYIGPVDEYTLMRILRRHK